MSEKLNQLLNANNLREVITWIGENTRNAKLKEELVQMLEETHARIVKAKKRYPRRKNAAMFSIIEGRNDATDVLQQWCGCALRVKIFDEIDTSIFLIINRQDGVDGWMPMKKDVEFVGLH